LDSFHPDQIHVNSRHDVGGRHVTHFPLVMVSWKIGPALAAGNAVLLNVARMVAGAIAANAGQVCVAGSRLIVQRQVADRLIDGIADAFGVLRARVHKADVCWWILRAKTVRAARRTGAARALLHCTSASAKTAASCAVAGREKACFRFVTGPLQDKPVMGP
jgi:hypothetical protein